MRFQMSLLEFLSYCSKSCKLSYLHTLDSHEKSRVLRALQKISPEDASLTERNDALDDYLTGQPPQPTARAARERLISCLGRSLE